MVGLGFGGGCGGMRWPGEEEEEEVEERESAKILVSETLCVKEGQSGQTKA